MVSHPVKPPAFRRGLYLACAVLLSMAWHGASELEDVDRIAPVLFGAAAGFALVGAIKVRSGTIWLISGYATAMAFSWRAGQIWAIEHGFVYQEPPDSSTLAFAVYVFCAFIGTPAAWRHWLRPREVL